MSGGVMTRSLPAPLTAGKLLIRAGSTSTTSASYVPVLNATVPQGQIWEPWSIMIAVTTGEDVAQVRLTIGGVIHFSDVNFNTRIPIYFVVPDKVKLEAGDSILVEVKSNGTTMVKAAAAITGDVVGS